MEPEFTHPIIRLLDYLAEEHGGTGEAPVIVKTVAANPPFIFGMARIRLGLVQLTPFTISSGVWVYVNERPTYLNPDHIVGVTPTNDWPGKDSA